MLDYNQGHGQPGNNDFAAYPRVVQSKYRFKDPYGGTVEEYYPQNIMHDKRIARGNTYAAMVIPAGTSSDAMMMDRQQQQETRRRTFGKSHKSSKRVPEIYPNRDIATPEPVPGRVHCDVQTEDYIEQLTDKPPTSEAGIATEFYLDRPPVPLFQPKMPAKENCKSTQIYDGDHELFDFDKEVEPMLNVLCEKTLEQARMEVLEEAEMDTMKIQRQEYEEVRNAELVEAQRFEAQEARVAAEISRRGVQQKARKAQRRAAHQKLVSRQIAKKHLVGLRENAMGQLHDQGVLQAPLKVSLHCDVLPWLLEKMNKFIQEGEEITNKSDAIVNNGILTLQEKHALHLTNRDKAAWDAEQERIRAAEANEIRKHERRLAREKRAKDQEKQRLKDEIRKLIIEKGSVQNPAIGSELLEVHGNYEKNKPFLGAVGGHVQQLYYVLCVMLENYQEDLSDYYARLQADPTDESLKQPQSAAELTLEHFFLPAFIQYVKELRCDQIVISIGAEMQALIDSLKLTASASGNYDFSKINPEQMLEFRHAFVEKRCYSEVLQANTNRRAMELIMTALFVIATKKVPAGVSSLKPETLSSKIKLVSVPKGVIVKDQVVTEKVAATADEPEKEVQKVIPANTKEKAVVRVLIPKKKMTPQEIEEANLDENADKSEDHTIEMDPDERALAVVARNNSLAYSVFVLNQYGQRAHRNDFLATMAKSCPADYLENNELIKVNIEKAAERMAVNKEEEFIAANCGEYEMPCLDYYIHAPDFE